MLRAIFFKNIRYLRQLPYHNLLHIPKHLRSMSSSRAIPLYTSQNIAIRNMTKKDLQLAFQWAEKESWNPGKHEINSLYAADPSGYYMLDVDGEPTASLAAVKYSENFAFLGLYIVIPSKRGEGYGAMLWNTITRKLENCSSIGLNAVTDQIERYGKANFSPSFFNTRWQGKLENIPRKIRIKDDDISLTDKFSIKDLITYDHKIFSTPRPAFLTQWVNMPESYALVALDSQGNIIGYGLISRTVKSNSYKIAPLLANNERVAEQLYTKLCSFIGKDATVSIDIPEKSVYAATMIEQFKLSKMFDTMRMYKGEDQKIDKDKVVGLTSLEIGN